MKLLTKDIIKHLPKLYSQDAKDPREVKIACKFFTPDSSWTWYVTEGDPVERFDQVHPGTVPDYAFFGLVVGHEAELGYFMLSELESARGPFGLPIERDLHFDKDATLDSVLRKEGKVDLADNLIDRRS